MNMLSMKATCSHSHGQLSSYFLGWEEYQKNPYHPTNNPSGIIQMGLAENQLSLEILELWIAKNSDASGFKENGVSIFTDLALFQDYNGLPSFKKVLAELMSEMRGNRVRFDEKKVILTAGATSASETLIFCIADPGQAFLIPTPYYPGFDRDLKWRTGVELVPIHCSSLTNFRITKSSLEDAYNRAQELNLQVKGVIITNPSNPLGTTMTKHELKHLIKFAAAKDIHIVSDEVYSGSVFNSPNFISIMEVAINNLHQNSDILNRVHIIYSLSKDFGLPGFRVGVIYSNNKILLSAATKMSSFGLVSAQTQFLLSNLIGDKKFRKFYIKENRKRIKKRQEMFVLGLENGGVQCLKSNAGLFCWVDMRHLLESNTFEAEIELWKKFIYQVGLNISPGSSCHCTEPGWFRMCFANTSEETLNVAVSRVKTVVDSIVCNYYWSTRRLTNKWVIQFQLSQCERDEQR